MKFLLFLLSSLAFTAFSQGIDLSLNLLKNNDYKLFTQSKIEVFEKKNGKVNKTKMDMKATINFHVTKVEKNEISCELRYEYFEMDITTKDTKLSISTDKTYDSEDYSIEGIMGRIFSEMPKNVVKMKLDRKGKILYVKGFDDLFVNAIDGFKKLPEEKREKLKQDIKNKYGQESFAANFELLTRVYPQTTIQLNDVWTNSNKVVSEKFMFNAENHFTLKEMTDEFVFVEDKIDYTPVLNAERKENQQEAQGEGDAYYKFNKKTGWIHECKVNQRIKTYDDIKKDPENYMLIITETSYTDH